MADKLQIELRELLLRLFTSSEIRQFAADEFGDPVVQMVNWNQGKNAVVSELVAALARTGLITPTLFRSILAVRPHQVASIIKVEELAESPSVKVSDVAQTERAYLQTELAIARKRHGKLQAIGEDTSKVRQDIIGLRKRLRAGRQLRPGCTLRQGGAERYTLIEQIGQGGFATVWKATDHATSNNVAVKVLHGQFSQDRTSRERFFRGARAMASLKHSNIVRIYHPHVEDDPFHYFVMELVRGLNLEQAVMLDTWDPSLTLAVTDALINALSAAHKANLVHRDIKPSNILLPTDAAPKLTDFDLVTGAHTTGGTRTGAMGTFLYAAPELLDRPQDATLHADIYGLGMTMIFMLLATRLPVGVLRSREQLISTLNCSPGVKIALRKATSWEPRLRYSSAAEFGRALYSIDPAIGPGNSCVSAKFIFFVSIDYDVIGLVVLDRFGPAEVPPNESHELLLLLAIARISGENDGWVEVAVASRCLYSRLPIDELMRRARMQFKKLGFEDFTNVIMEQHSSVRIGTEEVTISGIPYSARHSLLRIAASSTLPHPPPNIPRIDDAPIKTSIGRQSESYDARDVSLDDAISPSDEEPDTVRQYPPVPEK